MITAQEIQQVEAQRRSVKKETYKHIMEQFDKKIRKAVRIGEKSATLEVPGFVWGFPLYDVISAAAYLERQLTNLGYNVKRSETILIVTWGKGGIKAEAVENLERDLPSLVNLRKIAGKISQQDRNGGSRRSS
jgi:hypothetical protein